MSEQPFDAPRMAINRVYTRQGDAGETALAGGQRVPKDGLRIDAYGTVDELNAFVGAARVSAEGIEPLDQILLRVQHELFNLGSILATLPEDVHPKQARVTDAEVARLEAEMDRMNEGLEPLRSFILPGGEGGSAYLHVARSTVRRAERKALAASRERPLNPLALTYLNRLSDHLFVAARYLANSNGGDILWKPGATRHD